MCWNPKKKTALMTAGFALLPSVLANGSERLSHNLEIAADDGQTLERKSLYAFVLDILDSGNSFSGASRRGLPIV